MRRAAVLLAGALLAGCGAGAGERTCLPAPDLPDPAHPTAGMVRLQGGTFEMGAAALRYEEGRARRVRVAPFWIDRTEVTNAAFARFVDATGYRTVAERGQPASLVFDARSGWRVAAGADWRHPEGPRSSIAGKGAWPVVHIAWEDAQAYARWAGRDLPTEAEWEYAARGGLDGARYSWGDTPQQPGAPRANTWQGVFPVIDSGADGYKARAAPVGCYEPNGFGLSDMAGNVWEWTADWYRPGLEPASVLEQGGPPQARALDPDEPGAPKHVIKGGSFLCSDDFCFRYRPPARTPGPPDSGASHIGFRTVLREAGGA